MASKVSRPCFWLISRAAKMVFSAKFLSHRLGEQQAGLPSIPTFSEKRENRRSDPGSKRNSGTVGWPTTILTADQADAQTWP
jgi:hypothetical protein